MMAQSRVLLLLYIQWPPRVVVVVRVVVRLARESPVRTVARPGEVVGLVQGRG